MHEPATTDDRRAPLPAIRIRTDDWPERDRVAMFHEVFGRDRVRVQPARDEPLRIDATIVRVPDFAIVQARRSPLRSEFSDGNDRLIVNLGGPAIAVQFGREIPLERGDAIALSGSERGAFTTLRAGQLVTLEFSSGALMPLLARPHRGCARRIPRETIALRLLRGYVASACASEAIKASDLSTLVVGHLHDLAAMALGATREAEEIAQGRGVRAARLRSIKSDLRARLHQDIALGELAARYGVSERYVRMLFESDGTSVTAFVREERLIRARSMLLSPRFAARKIAEIAYEVGFNDLSYFNRSFRRRFGRSPSEVRERR